MAEHRGTPAVADPNTDPLRVVTMVLNLAMVLVVAGLALYLVTYVQDQREKSDCYQAAFNELNASLAVSRETARQDRAELRTLVTSLTDPEKSSQQRRGALDVFVAALDDADEERARAPLPQRTCR